MSSRYISHKIPKQNSRGFRIIHEFSDIDKHEEALRSLRHFCLTNPSVGKDNRPVSMRKATHGYPYGNRNMIDLTRNFMNRVNSRDTFIINSFDLSNFYHYITKDRMSNIFPQDLTEKINLAFVDIGNDIEVLAQGSPLSQDLSNICLLDIDLQSLTIANSINTWSKRSIEYKHANSRFFLPHGYPLGGRRDVPVTGRTYKSYLKGITGNDSAGLVFENLYNSDENLNDCITVSYLRYVDNIFVGVCAHNGINQHTLKEISTSITKRIKSLYLKEGFKINNLKNNVSTSASNRKVPILGMNVSKRVKCEKHYLNGIRAGLWNYAVSTSTDISQSLASSAIYALYVDPKSYNRFKKSMDKIINKGTENSPNAKSLINFSERENGLTGEIPCKC